MTFSTRLGVATSWAAVGISWAGHAVAQVPTDPAPLTIAPTMTMWAAIASIAASVVTGVVAIAKVVEAVKTNSGRINKQDELIDQQTKLIAALMKDVGHSRSEINNIKQENTAIAEGNLLDANFLRDTGREKGGTA